MPETKIRKAVRALWAHSASVLPCFVQICEILTFKQVVSLPRFSDCNKLIISFRNEKKETLLQKTRHCFSRYKSSGFCNTNVGTFRYLLEEKKKSVFLRCSISTDKKGLPQSKVFITDFESLYIFMKLPNDRFLLEQDDSKTPENDLCCNQTIWQPPHGLSSPHARY